MEWEPAKGVDRATTQTQSDEMEWDNDVHPISSQVEQTPQVAESSWAVAARQHSFASPVSTQGAASHGTTGSMRIIQDCADDALKNHFIKMKGSLGLRVICPPCWINSRDAMHKFDRCPDTAKAYVLVGSKFSTWKGLVDLPQWTCYSCCLPQVCPFSPLSVHSVTFSQLPGVHPNLNKGKGSCEMQDFIRPLLFALWDSSAWNCVMLDAFGLSHWISQQDFATWLTREVDRRDKLLNMHVVALWAYATHAGKRWYN